MISTLKTTFSLNDHKILRPKVTKKNLQICLRRFVNFEFESAGIKHKTTTGGK